MAVICPVSSGWAVWYSGLIGIQMAFENRTIWHPWLFDCQEPFDI